MSHSTSVLSIHIPPTIYTSGSYVEGEIHLNFRSLQDEPIDEVRITLRGRAKALNDNPRKQEARMLVDTSRVLWTYGAEYPPPGSDTLRLFFRWKLPDNLPPSTYYSGHLKAASVVYSLETVGLRRGVLKSDKKIHTPLVVLQSDSVGTQLPLGLSDVPWKKFYREQKVRKGFWGVSDPGTVTVELLLPDVPALPLFTKTPYIIDIITTTAPLARSKANAQPAHKAIFPPPPAIHTELMFRLIRRTAIHAQGRYDSGDIEAVRFLGLARSGADVDTDLPEKEWAAADETNRSGGDEVGTWIQRARFQSKMFLIVFHRRSIAGSLRARTF
ncbi:hypothetical protein OH76DRAFT_1467291 [Lentinus brumalis]|uniref:Arrestin-like N-terminal domain-containing protein n=1 Tax=Lentinus brumalis TaxID=2498619 RepID=A0A371CLK2_9APHY|nr:hypothetical protein OH76DRAFT_1467291 [Polyporus brumalis]